MPVAMAEIILLALAAVRVAPILPMELPAQMAAAVAAVEIVPMARMAEAASILRQPKVAVVAVAVAAVRPQSEEAEVVCMEQAVVAVAGEPMAAMALLEFA